MKNILILCSVITILFSCTSDITNLNENTKEPTVVPAEYLFTTAQKAIVDQMTSTNVNNNVFRLFVQHWTETVYTDESNYDITTRTIPDTHFLVLYRDVLKDLKEAKMILSSQTPSTSDEIAVVNNKKAIIDILTAYSYSILVDTFGNVPYTQALDINLYPNPAYDNAESIYRDLISKLTVASNSLNLTKGSFKTADLIYGGNSTKWKMFANSLRLKLAINMDDLDHTYATSQAIAAVNSGVISNKDDNTSLKYLGVQPNTNPIYVDVVASGRDDFVPTKTIIDKMNTLNDPRRSSYFTLNKGNYVGGTPGAGNTFSNFSHIGTKIVAPTFEALLFDSSEVEFLLAEAVSRGIAVGGTAKSHYDLAIRASLSYWGVEESEIISYLAQPSVDYSTATGNWKQKIGEQSYIALYNRGFESWTAYRRLDFPVLVAPVDAAINEVPKRYTYPAGEQTLNNKNVTAASTAIGGNTMTAKIFWDKF